MNIREKKIEKFNNLIFEFKRLSKPKRAAKTSVELLESLTILTQGFSTLVEKVYDRRYNETLAIINENRHKVEFSTFELMEHNYRENTHSNILRHIFHHKFIEVGSKIFADFILSITNDDKLYKLILEKEYEIYREYLTNKGRIDLLIEDTKNKFVIVIENKIYADVAVKEVSEEGEIIETQLDNYDDYIDKNYGCNLYKILYFTKL
jgi:hypothetical protein